MSLSFSLWMAGENEWQLAMAWASAVTKATLNCVFVCLGANRFFYFFFFSSSQQQRLQTPTETRVSRWWGCAWWLVAGSNNCLPKYNASVSQANEENQTKGRFNPAWVLKWSKKKKKRRKKWSGPRIALAKNKEGHNAVCQPPHSYERESIELCC